MVLLLLPSITTPETNGGNHTSNHMFNFCSFQPSILFIKRWRRYSKNIRLLFTTAYFCWNPIVCLAKTSLDNYGWVMLTLRHQSSLLPFSLPTTTQHTTSPHKPSSFHLWSWLVMAFSFYSPFSSHNKSYPHLTELLVLTSNLKSFVINSMKILSICSSVISPLSELWIYNP